MQQFWSIIQEHPDDIGKTSGEVAFVLPRDYGWGLRRSDDSIWGLWSADDLSSAVWRKVNWLVERFGLRLDIVYDDARFILDGYSKVYYWNSTID
jgi:hypothetical protein